jgi:hypothetical protein
MGRSLADGVRPHQTPVCAGQERSKTAGEHGRAPRDAVDRVVRHLLRVGLYFRRTGEVAALRTAFDSLGHMVRKNADEQYQKRSAASRDEVSRSLGPEELLAALGN